MLGWSFAPEGGAPLAGFEAIDPQDPRLSGPGPRPVRRPGGDALLARGMAGITPFATPLPPGRWRITLWTEDPGEWETLPPLVEHRVRVNGVDLLQFRRSPDEWVRQRYLAGQAAEAAPQVAPSRASAPAGVAGLRAWWRSAQQGWWLNWLATRSRRHIWPPFLPNRPRHHRAVPLCGSAACRPLHRGVGRC